MFRRLLSLPCAVALMSVVLIPDAEAAPVVKPLMGVAAYNQSSFDTLNRVAPMLVRRSYNGALPSSFAKSAAGSDVAGKRTSYWSFKPNAKTFATDAKAQAAFAAFLDTIPKGHKTVITLWHEPEDNIRAGQFTLAQWGAMTTRAGQIIDAKSRPELRLAVCFMGPWTFDSRSPYYAYDWRSVLDLKVVDVVGIDPYKLRTKVSSLQQILTVSNYGSGGKVASTMQRLAEWKKPVAIMEWGVPKKDVDSGAAMTDATRGKWIADGYHWMKAWNAGNSVKIEAAIYFHLNFNGNWVYLSKDALTAWRAAHADSKR